MYELHVPLVMLSNRALQRGPAGGEDPNVIKKNLKVKLSRKYTVVMKTDLITIITYRLIPKTQRNNPYNICFAGGVI